MHNFETVHDRRKTRSVKWDNLTALYGGEDVLPMWVADMDFQSPRSVIDALKYRAEHGIYGYTITDASISKTVSKWVEKRHGWRMKPSWLLYSPGVVTSLHMALYRLLPNLVNKSSSRRLFMLLFTVWLLLMIAKSSKTLCSKKMVHTRWISNTWRHVSKREPRR